MTTLHTVSFQKTVLASMIGLCLSQSVFALENLEQLDDSALSQTTGEGIALLPDHGSGMSGDLFQILVPVSDE